MGKVTVKTNCRGKAPRIKSKDLIPGGRNKVTYVRIPPRTTVPLPKARTSSPVTSQPQLPFSLQDDDPQPSQPQTTDSPYVQQKKREYESWTTIRDSLYETSLKLAAPISSTCTRWSKCTGTLCGKPAAYRCRECAPLAAFCEECLLEEHINSFHVPEEWKNGFFQPYRLSNMMQLPPQEDCRCGDRFFKSVRVFDSAGRFQYLEISFCNCEQANCTLLKYGLWGATATDPKTAFSTSLLEWLVLLGLESQVSVEAFCRTLRMKNNLSHSEMQTLYHALVGQPIAEFRHLMFRERNMKDLCPSLDDGTTCPACPKENGAQILSLDGNFGLVRKKSSGSSIGPPLRGKCLFVDDEHVQSYMESYCDESRPDEDCSNFKAGNSIRSRSKQTKLDVNGVFGSVCRHEIPRLFLNMTHGERLGYPVCLIERLLEEVEGKNVKLNIIYDISCILESHLKKTEKGRSLLERITVALDVFHAFGHKSACQIKYSTRRCAGFGLTDGEAVERVWAFLRRFGSMTKEMSPSRRVDLLTDALLHFSLKKTIDIDITLDRKMDKALKTISIAEEALSSVMHDANVSLSDIELWSQREKQAIDKGKSSTSKSATMCKWKKLYVVKRLQLKAVREKIASGQTDNAAVYQSTFLKLDEELKEVERKHKISQRWTESSEEFVNAMKEVDWDVRTSLLSKMRGIAYERSFLISLKRKYPNGQAISSKLSKQLTTSNTKLQKAVNAYNAVEWEPTTSDLPPSGDFKDVTDPEWQGYSCLDPSVMEASRVPRSVQRKGIDNLHLLQRAREEVVLIREEMKNVFDHFQTQYDCTELAIANDCNTNDQMSIGKHAVLRKHTSSLGTTLKMLYDCFSKHVPDLPIQQSTCLVIFPMLEVDHDGSLDMVSDDDISSGEESDDDYMIPNYYIC